MTGPVLSVALVLLGVGGLAELVGRAGPRAQPVRWTPRGKEPVAKLDASCTD